MDRWVDRSLQGGHSSTKTGPINDIQQTTSSIASTAASGRHVSVRLFFEVYHYSLSICLSIYYLWEKREERKESRGKKK